MMKIVEKGIVIVQQEKETVFTERYITSVEINDNNSLYVNYVLKSGDGQIIKSELVSLAEFEKDVEPLIFNLIDKVRSEKNDGN